MREWLETDEQIKSHAVTFFTELYISGEVENENLCTLANNRSHVGKEDDA